MIRELRCVYNTYMDQYEVMVEESIHFKATKCLIFFFDLEKKPKTNL